jgi:uncharacterized protein (DUF1800 family)
MKKTLLFYFLSSLISLGAYSQDFIGSGNTNVTISTSSTEAGTSEQKVISGDGLEASKYDASKFLSQAAFVYTEEDIDLLSDGEYEAWIDAQIELPITYVLPIHDEEFEEARDLFYANGGSDYYGPSDKHFNYAWWTTTQIAEDQLRHRVALALSEIFVISGNSDLGAFGEGLANFYDILLDGSFGNFKNILEDVTYNPCMGFYLSHLNNQKTFGNIRPDENYAREIMQLFTIGLYELNNDGSYQLQNGEPIPTYDQDDIKEFAKVFTGLKGGGWDHESNNTGTPNFGVGIYNISKTVPMVPDETKHEPGIKYLLNGATTNSSTNGDIEKAITNLFNHPNVGPFIGKQLIQRLVKSNPSPEYINRVANAFNGIGGVERGNMAEVIKAVLLDEEARQADYELSSDAGRMKEPIVRYAQIVGLLDKDNPTGNYWNNGFNYQNDVSQHPMQSPTVFNFFLPDYEPSGLYGLVSPEFQIFNTRTSINWVNFIHSWVVWETLFYDWEENTENVYVDYTRYYELSNNTEEYINYFDKMFTHGTLDDFTREQIRIAMNSTSNQSNKAKLGLYLILTSPAYSIQK